jgi:hypothetical protein
VAYGVVTCLANATAQSAAVGPITVHLNSGEILQAHTQTGQTILKIIPPKAAPLTLALGRDSTVSVSEPVYALNIIGDIPGSALVESDTYWSMPGGLSMCQSGQEQFLRVITITKHKAREALRLKIGSCINNVQLASPGIQWSPKTGLLQIHWLLGPDGKEQPDDQTYRITETGQVQPRTSH